MSCSTKFIFPASVVGRLFLLPWAAVFLSLICSPSVRADEFSIKVSARISQFATPNTQNFTGQDDVAQPLPTVSVSQTSTNGNVSTSASASPFALTAQFSSTDAGLAVSRANATLVKSGIIFEDNQALRDLIGQSGTHLDLLLNFDVSYRMATIETPGRFRQALSSLDINLLASSVTGGGSNFGDVRILNSPFEHTFTATGFLAGMPENGGQTRATVPFRITPFTVGGLSARFTAFADISGLAFGDTSFSNGIVSITVPDLPFFVTTPDGTSATDLGLKFGLTPRVTPDPGPEPVPEPATMILLGTGLTGVGAILRRRRRDGEDKEA